MLFFILRSFLTIGSDRNSRVSDKGEENPFIQTPNCHSKYDENIIKFPAAKDSLVQLDDSFFPSLHYWSSEHLAYSSSERKQSRNFITDGKLLSELKSEITVLVSLH